MSPQPAVPAIRVLLVDDDVSFREVLGFHLLDLGLTCDLAADGEEALKLFELHRHGLVITDLKMPNMGGMDLLRAIRRRTNDSLVIVITAFGDVPTAIESMKSGAFDFLPKPCDREHFKLTVKRALEHWSLRVQLHELSDRLDSAGKELVFASETMTRLVAMVDRIASSEGTVLIHGESGTGKELIARRIHRASPRAHGPFVALNCAAIPHDLLEAELFGHVKGAFTGAVRDRKGRFEQANRGTVFLDEIGDVPVNLQTRLLRVLQERVVDVIGGRAPVPVDVRVVAATNKDLAKAVQKGAFREDLYFRLAVLPISVPPLRDRRADIPALVEHFLHRYAGDRQLSVGEELMQELVRREWRGNVRELENTCHRMALMAEEEVLTSALLEGPDAVCGETVSLSGLQLPAGGLSLLDLEREVILKALELNGHNQSRTARYLRIPRHILLYRAEKYGISLKARASSPGL